MTGEHFWTALGLTALAGISTGIGGVFSFFTSRSNRRFLTVALGFSAGVMIYLSLSEILVEGRETLVAAVGDSGGWLAAIAFFGGIALIAGIDRLIPDIENPHERPEALPPAGEAAGARIGGSDDSAAAALRQAGLLRVGLLTAAVVIAHNLPEGLTTFIVALRDPALALPIAIAIALHNIPEGVAVAIPIYYATGSRPKSVGWAFASGFAEPVGALAGYLLLRPFLGDVLFGILFAAIAGIMVFISLDQLLPTAEKYGEHHLAVYGLVAGMAMMAASLLLF